MAFANNIFTPSVDLQKKKERADQYAADYNWRNDQDTVAANAEYQAAKQNKPTYANTYGGQVEEAYNALNNRQPFKYDVAGDALYQQYKDQYIMRGQQAMMDTMGQAAALTGGYGNSYAQSAGQQAYQGYLQQLNDKVPELYQLALQKYQMEGDALKDKYRLARDMSDQEYAQYRDAVGDYNNDVNAAYGRFQDALNYGAGQYNANRSWAADTYNNAYSQEYGAFQNGEDARFSAYQQDVAERNAANDLALQYAKMAQDQAQYDANLAQNQAQFDKQLAEDKRQFNEKMTQEKDRYEESLKDVHTDDGLKDVKPEMYDEAVQVYKTEGEDGVARYIAKLKGYRTDDILSYIDEFYAKTPNTRRSHVGGGGTF